jgi:DNA-binding NtrC family response regulator
MTDMVETETFRRDLFHRISTFPIAVPALNERIDDIPLLANSFLKRVAGDRGLHFSAATLEALMRRRYTGNIRELRNIVERASILADGNEIAPSHLDMDPCCSNAPDTNRAPVAPAAPAFVVDAPIALEDLERSYLRWLQARFDGDRRSMAASLKVGMRTLYRKLKSAA